MKSIEGHGSSFVVRIWLEPREVKGTDPEWRGRVEHVQTGERIYFRGLDRMIDFMMSYLGDSGGPAPLVEKTHGVRAWLTRLWWPRA